MEKGRELQGVLGVMVDGRRVAEREVVLVVLARASGAPTAASSDPPNLSAPENQMKRNDSSSLEGCESGRRFQTSVFLRGGRDGAQWPGSMSPWRICYLSPPSELNQHWPPSFRSSGCC